MDLSKFTAEYIAEAPAAELNAERKALIRHMKECHVLATLMRTRLVEEGEEQHAADIIDKMGIRQKRALERALSKSKTTGTGTVS